MENAVVTLTFSVNDLNIIMASLGKQPFEVVAELVQKIGSEARNQLDSQKKSEAPIE
jgi:hypothetical protein